jgi:alkanesulfonate monooxygenase SsuD/methylene tetrahydromethanopterin reductase-like flavin-dependent oxidoreductase (luciferase family)
MAQLLEKGKFDGLFLADVWGGYDVYNGNLDAALRSGAQFPVTDPHLAISAMASVTKNLTFGVTSTTSYEHPYALARKFSTLDHLTDGRVGEQRAFVGSRCIVCLLIILCTQAGTS